MPKLIDGFTFYNELKMLSFRLEELYNIVDHFIIVEATKTFAGNDKELYFQNNKNKYAKYLDKIIHIIVDDMPCTSNAWDNEHHQRRGINTGINQLNLEDADIIIITDCDEIPDSDTLLKIKEQGLDDLYRLEMDMYYYNLLTKGTKWYKASILPYFMYKLNNCDPQKIRISPFSKNNLTMRKGGWHFSFFGNTEFIKNKIKNFSHQEYNQPKFLDDDKINTQIKNFDDVFFRNNAITHAFHKVELANNNYLPKNYKLLLTSPIYIYIHICIKGTWLDILTNIITNIKKSGLYDIIDKIKCFILGNLNKIPDIFNDEKIIIVKQDPNIQLYERFTLNNLYNDCLKEEFYVLYLHTKGIQWPNSQQVKDWVEYLIYFNMFKKKEIIDFLENYDTVGVNLQPGPHYSGNFWWSKSSHIKTLNKNIGSNYTDPEFWVTSKKGGKYLSLYLSGINHYNTTYPKEKYISKGINIYTREN